MESAPSQRPPYATGRPLPLKSAAEAPPDVVAGGEAERAAGAAEDLQQRHLRRPREDRKGAAPGIAQGQARAIVANRAQRHTKHRHGPFYFSSFLVGSEFHLSELSPLLL